MKCRVFERRDGSVMVITPSVSVLLDGETEEQCADRMLAKVLEHRQVQVTTCTPDPDVCHHHSEDCWEVLPFIDSHTELLPDDRSSTRDRWRIDWEARKVVVTP